MQILFFPTRYFPAISGGDFCLQRLAEEMQKSKKQNISYHPDYTPNRVQVLTSDAIDFAALHGKGKIVKNTHKNLKSYRNVSISRLPVAREKKGIETEVRRLKTIFHFFFPTLINNFADLFENIIVNGPILPDLGDLLENKESEKIISLKWKPDIIHCSYLPYTNLIYALLLGKLWKIPVVVTPFLHEMNIRYQDHSILLLLSQFDSIFACTEYESQVYIKYV